MVPTPLQMSPEDSSTVTTPPPLSETDSSSRRVHDDGGSDFSSQQMVASLPVESNVFLSRLQGQKHDPAKGTTGDGWIGDALLTLLASARPGHWASPRPSGAGMAQDLCQGS